MADNTLQWDWIVSIKLGLEILFASRSDVFIASNLIWYPVEGSPKISTVPDVMVVFGRPKGVRGSYMQWKEGGLPFQVVFEVLSPIDRGAETARKIEFYRRYGVLEYYLYDPGDLRKALRTTCLAGWQRDSATEEFVEVEEMDGWRSPHLGITFRHDPKEGLRLLYPNGRRFETYQEVAERVRLSDFAEQSAQQVERLVAQLRAAGIEPEIGS